MDYIGKRIFSGTLACAIAMLTTLYPLSNVVMAEDDTSGTSTQDFSQEKDKISDLSSTYKELQDKQKEITAQINKATDEKSKQIAIKQQIGGQIETTKQQINVLTQKITLLEEEISTKEKELALKQAEIDKNYDLFKLRVRAMATKPQTSTVGVVLGADSYSQFVMRGEVMSRVAQYDRDMIEDLTKQKQELTKVKQEIEEDKTSVESDKVEMDSRKQDLGTKMQETQSQIQDIAALEQEFLANKAQIQAQMKKVQSEIDSIYAEIARKSTQMKYIGGIMLQPTPTLSQVTSSYGYRFGGSDFHTGIDFSGGSAYGQPIVAANAGKVAFVNLAVTPGYGYGKYLIIDHGGGITTLYGHTSNIVVSVGQTVSRGQKIAEVGSTGWSTGPHCHFEVRVNGQHTNPVAYLQG